MEIRGAILLAVIVVGLAGPAVASAQEEVPASAYDRAAQMLGVASLIFNESVTPHWIGDGEAFWYRSDDRDGHRFWRVEPLASDERRRPAFDHARLAASLSGLRDVPAEPLAAIRQLAVRYPQMDLDRVGVYGHSGGGFASARAIFAYPEFYKVAVSSAGNHDQRGYIQLWGESYHGDPKTVSYEEQANASIAHQLEGKLLLAYGALDDNVPPALTLQVIEALTRANRDYDLIVLPSGNHGFLSDPYFIRRSWDYFVRHLAGMEPPADYRLSPPGS